MNREIKFRIWDKIRSCYAKQITTYKLDRNNNINLIIYLDKTNKMQEIKECDKIYTNEFIIQQYTGLKDKNDKEIYEGDIVIFRNGNYEVIYNYDRFELKNFNEYIFENNQKLFIHYDLQDCIVIGNVYQNPKLLEDINE